MKNDEKIKVRITRGCVTSEGAMNSGKTVELPADEAKYLCAIKKAMPAPSGRGKKATTSKKAGENTSDE